MSKAETIEAIAEHFTNSSLVAHNSISLQLPGLPQKLAKQFFDTRAKLGIRGYPTKEEAVRSLEDLLREHP